MIQPDELKKDAPLLWSTGHGTDIWALFCACVDGDLATIKRLIEKGVTVFAVRDDLEERGLDPSNCIAGVKMIRRHDVALLFDDYNQVWHW